MSRPIYTTQRQLRAAFWAANPGLSRRRIRNYGGTGLMFTTDTRVAFVEWLDATCRNGECSAELAQRATLGASDD